MSPEESKIVAGILRPYLKESPHLSLEYLVEKWNRFVLNVGQGYNLTIFDYTNSLGTRDFIEVVLVGVPEALHSKLLNIIEPLDRQFVQATKQVVEAVLPWSGGTLGWWWYRVPVKLHEPPDDFEHWAPYYDHENGSFDPETVR